MPWRRKWPATPVFLPGESHSQRSLAGYSTWGQRSQTHWSAHTHTHMHTHAQTEPSCRRTRSSLRLRLHCTVCLGLLCLAPWNEWWVFEEGQACGWATQKECLCKFPAGPQTRLSRYCASHLEGTCIPHLHISRHRRWKWYLAHFQQNEITKKRLQETSNNYQAFSQAISILSQVNDHVNH